MFDGWIRFIQGSGFMPHGYCLRWDPGLLTVFIIGNLIIAIAYFSIPAALLTFVRKRRDLAFSWIFILFGLFIVSCGTTHLLKIITLYQPLYWAEAGMDLFTGVVSIVTAFLLWPLVPKVLELPSPQQLSEKNQLLQASMEESSSLNAELKDLNQQLRVARDRAIEASNAKSAFVAAISHELRTPLTAILGMNELLSASMLNPEQMQLSHNVQMAAASLLDTVNDVLDLSRLEAGKLEIESIPFLVSDLLGQCLKNVESSAARKNLVLKTTIDTSLPYCLMGDAARLKQILTNLLSNAVKFTEEGTIDLALELLPRDESSELKVRFSVSDTGVGIADADRERIFQPFTQADQSTARRYGGSGLGLSIANYLAVLMDSEIRVESQLGQGSRFWFDLDLSEGKLERSQKQTYQHFCPVFPQSRVLVVDDDPFLQKLAGMQLEKLRLQVSIAGSGEEVLKYFSEGRKFDLILMDCHMPGQDGYSLTRSLRAMPGLAGLPIIAVTAGAMIGDRERCIAAGMDDYLSKPYTLKQLGEVLQRWLSHAEPEPDRLAQTPGSQAGQRQLLDLEKLKKTYGAAACSEIVETFFQSAEPILQELVLSRQSENAERIKFLAHRLKGASAMACIEQLSRSSRNLEESAGKSDWVEIDLLLEELKSLLEKARCSQY